MKIFLDTANIDEIRAWVPTGLIDGVTTNPSHFAKEKKNPLLGIKELCALLPEGEISVEVTEKDPQAVYKQAQEIAAISDLILVKIPCHKDYYQTINQLVQAGVRINITLVFSLMQAAFMCKLGVAYISPFVGRLDDIDVEGTDLLVQIRSMIDEYGYDTQLLAASIRTVRHFHEAIMAGADAVTISPEILKKSTEHSLTNEGMAKFDADWATLGIKQFP